MKETYITYKSIKDLLKDLSSKENTEVFAPVIKDGSPYITKINRETEIALDYFITVNSIKEALFPRYEPILKYTVSKDEVKLIDPEVDKKIIIFPTALHAYRSYQQFDDKNQAAIVHGALSLLQRSEMIVKWQNGYINTLFSTEKFHENYGKYFLAKISAHNVQIEKKEDYLNNMLIKSENWQDFIPSRDFLLALYKILRAKISFTAKHVFISLEFEEIICFLAEQGWQDCTCQQVKIGLDILEEMNLLNRELEGEKNYLCALPIPEEKFNLSSLLRYQEQLAIENYLK